MKSYFSEIVAREPSQVVKDAQLITAATYGDTPCVVELLRKGARVDASENSPLQLAAANGHADTVRVLLKSGAKRNDPEALIEASKNGYDDVVKLLVAESDSSTINRALRFAKERHRQTPGAFRARAKTPAGGHDRTIKILLGTNRPSPAR